MVVVQVRGHAAEGAELRHAANLEAACVKIDFAHNADIRGHGFGFVYRMDGKSVVCARLRKWRINCSTTAMQRLPPFSATRSSSQLSG